MNLIRKDLIAAAFMGVVLASAAAKADLSCVSSDRSKSPDLHIGFVYQDGNPYLSIAKIYVSAVAQPSADGSPAVVPAVAYSAMVPPNGQLYDANKPNGIFGSVTLASGETIAFENFGVAGDRNFDFESNGVVYWCSSKAVGYEPEEQGADVPPPGLHVR